MVIYELLDVVTVGPTCTEAFSGAIEQPVMLISKMVKIAVTLNIL